MENSIICPVCLGIPEQEIYQCTNGHIVCHICASKLATCPQCRIALGTTKIRARVLEGLLDNQRFDCVYKGKGCDQKCTRKDHALHAKSCGFNPDNTSFCKLVGYGNCNFKLDSSSRAQIISHFENNHFATMLHFDACYFKDGSTFNIYHEKFYKRLLRDDFNGYWTPVILTSDESETSALYLVAAKHSYSEIAWECINIWGNGSDIQNYDVHFSIKNDKISSQRMQRDRSPFSIYEFVNTVQNVQSAHVFENVSSTIHPFDTWIKESDKKAFKKTKPFTFSLRGLSRNARAYEESLILCIEIRIQGGSTHHSNIRSNLVDCKDLWTFFHPNIQDDETKEVAAKLQKARICQKQSQLKLKKQNEAIVAKLKQLELQHNEIKSSILESERKLDEEHRQKKSERLKYIRHQKLNLENQIKEKQKQITLRENEMLERHMLERQKLNEEKLAIQKEREFIFTTFEKDTLQKTTLNQHMVEKNELKQKHISMESHMIEEIKLLSDQLLEKENEGKEIVKKQRQIEMQIGILEGQMLCDQWLDTQILQKKKQIDAQKKELEEQMMGRNNEMLARLTLEKQRLESEKQKQWTRMKSEINQL